MYLSCLILDWSRNVVKSQELFSKLLVNIFIAVILYNDSWFCNQLIRWWSTGFLAYSWLPQDLDELVVLQYLWPWKIFCHKCLCLGEFVRRYVMPKTAFMCSNSFLVDTKIPCWNGSMASVCSFPTKLIFDVGEPSWLVFYYLIVVAPCIQTQLALVTNALSLLCALFAIMRYKQYYTFFGTVR